MITKETIVGSRNILADGQIQVRLDTYVYEDGELIAGPEYWREVIHPGQDVSDRDPAIKRIAAVEHTPPVIAAFQAAEAERNAKSP